MSGPLSTHIAAQFEDAVGRTRDALTQEGFGVLTEIDVRAALKSGLGVDMEDYLILGACNPALAHRAINENREMGLLLPCNVDVYAVGDRTRVVAVNAGAMLGMVGNTALAPIAGQVQERLDRVLESL